MGRQPWTIQDLLPTMISTSNINANAVIITFWLFFAVLSILFIADVKIILNVIKKGPNKINIGDK
jgi:cytochrome d ubiquinol oxidase subunit I